VEQWRDRIKFYCCYCPTAIRITKEIVSPRPVNQAVPTPKYNRTAYGISP